MNTSKLIATALLLAGVALAQTASLPELKKQFESDVRAVQIQQREKSKAAGEQYAKVLEVVEQKIAERGNEQALTWVRAERKRFEGEGEIPAAALVKEDSPLRQHQDTCVQQQSAARMEAAQRIAELAGKYVAALNQLQQQSGGKLALLVEIKDETDRVLGNSVIRDALALAKTAPAKPVATEPAATKPDAETPKPVASAKPLTGPVTVGNYKFFPPGKEPTVKELKSLRLDFPSVAARSSASGYGLGAAVFSDKEKMESNRQNLGWVAFRQEHGLIHTGARLTLACHGRDLPEGAKLMVHYFSHPANSLSELREERVEQITLPALPRGQTVVVDGTGILLGKFDHRGTYGRVKIGDEFYGLIVSLFDASGALLIQQCSSTTLAKACTGKLPEAKPQEDLRARYGGGKP